MAKRNKEVIYRKGTRYPLPFYLPSIKHSKRCVLDLVLLCLVLSILSTSVFLKLNWERGKRMAMLSASSSSPMLSSTSSSSASTKLTSFNYSKSPFVVFSVALSKEPYFPTTFATSTTKLLCGENRRRRSFRVCCQDLSFVPTNERWMFEESEVNGPVCRTQSLSVFI